jgi:hypothetical protein
MNFRITLGLNIAMFEVIPVTVPTVGSWPTNVTAYRLPFFTMLLDSPVAYFSNSEDTTIAHSDLLKQMIILRWIPVTLLGQWLTCSANEVVDSIQRTHRDYRSCFSHQKPSWIREIWLPISNQNASWRALPRLSKINSSNCSALSLFF